MKFAGTTSIKKKLTMIIMLITSLALLMACSTFIVYDLITFKSGMVREVKTLAEIVGINSAAALTFNDEDAASETLRALTAEKNITCAFIYSKTEQPFARYVRHAGLSDVAPPPPQQDGHRFQNDRMSLFHGIELDGEKIGTIYMQSDLSILRARFKRYALMVFIVLVISSFSAFMMTAKLRKVISQPILNLAKMAKMVSDKKDYSVRAVKHSRDELGYLTARFNEMLTQIEERDQELQKAKRELESQARRLQNELAERKRIDRELRKSEERFRDLFDNAPDMYMILDPQANIQDFNKWGLAALGFGAEEIKGKHLRSLVYHNDLLKAEKFVMQIQRTCQAPKNLEIRLIRKNGQFLWVSTEFSLVKDEAGKLQSIRVVCRDITERKRLQNELERAQRLEAAGRIAGQIAHDFNNLLGPLAAYPTLIREDLPQNHSVLDMVDDMQLAAKKIAEINQQLLALGRRGHYTMEPIDLNGLIKTVVSSQVVPENVTTHQELATDLFLILGGSAQLTRALTNLVVNAIEALQGPGQVVIRTQNVYLDEPLLGYQTIERGEYVKLEISDTGTGIQPGLIDRIFDPFFTTKTTDRMRGSGLGLSVVHGIIEDHKGYITVTSTPRIGTAFSVYFPVSREVDHEVAETVERVQGGDETILIVDDDPIQRRVTSQLLERLGYQIQTACSGEEAIEFVRKDPQDLVMLDMVMEGIDGTETYQRILNFKPRQKAIVLSGYAKSKRVEKALHLGAGSFIAKPISLSALATAVRAELDK